MLIDETASHRREREVHDVEHGRERERKVSVWLPMIGPRLQSWDLGEISDFWLVLPRRWHRPKKRLGTNRVLDRQVVYDHVARMIEEQY